MQITRCLDVSAQLTVFAGREPLQSPSFARWVRLSNRLPLQIIVDNDQARVKDGLPVEAHITAGLNHRNVVRTIAHAWRPLVSHVNASMSVWDSAGSNAVGPFASCNEGETWLLLELCDRGTLQVIPLPALR